MVPAYRFSGPIGPVIIRSALQDAADEIPRARHPLQAHAYRGMGDLQEVGNLAITETHTTQPLGFLQVEIMNP